MGETEGLSKLPLYQYIASGGASDCALAPLRFMRDAGMVA